MVIGSLGVGPKTGRENEVMDVMERKEIDVLCVQETRCKGQKARKGEVGINSGEESRRNNVRTVLSLETKDGYCK